MFDTNFTFLSGDSEPITTRCGDSTSADVSPFTSRCTSPYQQFFSSSATSARTTRDSRYDAYRPRGSITALTAQLQSHAIQERRDSIISVDPDSDAGADPDEGYCEGPNTPSTTASDYSDDFDPSLYDLSMCRISATSSPRPSMSLEAQALSSYTMRRRQRQTLVRLQCLVNRTPDLAMLIEECHPSSLPLAGADSMWEATPRSLSTSSAGAGGGAPSRIEKGRSANSVHKLPRMRKRLTR